MAQTSTDGNKFPSIDVMGLSISVGSFQAHLDHMVAMAHERKSAYVCCVNSHMTVEARRSTELARAVHNATLATADGMPLLRTIQLVHGVKQERVAGNDLMPALLSAAAKEGLNVFLYGGEQDVLDTIQRKAIVEWPALRIVGALAPPFRQLSAEERSHHLEVIHASGAHLVMVSLGCPKQELWMASMYPELKAVMIGLGGAFLLYAGVDKRAPKWMRDLSLEWCYRLALEPQRLWKRYLVTNTIFLGLMIKEAVKKFFPRSGRPA